ncbi:PQQ-dependent sugar dehydrogenase [Bacillus alkalicellulosilyticus]|uniref:PQQ-dependent sugar dehydrogenase n=1 Tax=Alkalihalobacterium alkalicellulosilyticum TaxID=1912214 RepID=UPI0009961503|nr:PQQ-dependent sugar dehydrogenase [Bacillus alkalicellulosilyticus]
MKKMIGVSICLLFMIAGCATTIDDPNTEPDQEVTLGEGETEDKQDQIKLDDSPEVIAENLTIPWSIELFEDTFYVTERQGAIIKIENGEMERQDVVLDKELASVPEAGLLGFVLDPEFSQSNRAYAYYTYADSSGPLNRIVTLRLEDNVWREKSVLLDEIPSGTVHHGGRLKIGDDGKLYATTGDAAVPTIAQDLNSLGGKIVRMNLDGSIPSDNPFSNSYVYSYGHRNPQGLTWSSSGTLFSSEHGNSANDEINVIEAGQNYGWPVIEGHEEQEGMISPLFTSGNTNTWAPSGMDYDNGKLYVAALRGSAVLEFNIETGEQREVISGLGRIRDIRIEGQSLYFITNNTDGRGNPDENDDKLYRVFLSDLN